MKTSNVRAASAALFLIATGPGCAEKLPAANGYPSDHPLAKGQSIFLHDAWGTEQLDSWPPADFMLGLMTSEPEVFGNQFEKFGFVSDPDDDFPFGLKRGLVDSSKVHETCAMCHVARLPDGKVWFGAPNTRLEIGRFQVEVNKRWSAAGHPALMNALGESKALRLGPGRFNAETSEYPQVVAADFPSYFTLGKRTALNYMGTGQNVRTEAFFAIYTFGAGSPTDATAKVPFPDEERLSAFLSFFGSLSAPDAPPQDAALVSSGRAVFAKAQCGSCHHVDHIEQDGVVTLDSKMDGKERLPGQDPAFPRGSLRTSKLHRILQDGDGTDMGPDPGFDNLIQFIAKHGLSVRRTDGYRTSDLRGLWATAPYLHNGSVPTLLDLLKPQAQRLAVWQNGSFQVDTRLIENGNEGHEFGVELSADEKTALVAYLNSL